MTGVFNTLAARITMRWAQLTKVVARLFRPEPPPEPPTEEPKPTS